LPITELALFAEYLLHFSDFSFHFAGDLFRGPSVLQIGVSNRLPGLFFHFASNLFAVPFTLSVVLEFMLLIRRRSYFGLSRLCD
jgi:hypothetical protein